MRRDAELMAICRVDDFSGVSLEDKFSIVRVVHGVDGAAAEVDRLNSLNDKHPASTYFAQLVRFDSEVLYALGVVDDEV